MGFFCMYEPLKFQYLIHKVESASTAQEEKNAFRLARRWGRVWETNWLPANSNLELESPAANAPKTSCNQTHRLSKTPPGFGECALCAAFTFGAQRSSTHIPTPQEHVYSGFPFAASNTTTV